jgi:predicted  nucleic acid-binding Zn-ribbon protein
MNKWLAWLWIIVVLPVFPFTVSAEEKQPYFTNEDVKIYRKSPDGQPALPKKNVKEEKKATASMAKDEKEQEHWCKQANQRRKKIDTARDDVVKAEKDLSREKEKNSGTGGKKNSRLQDRLDQAKRRLSVEEKELHDLENEAHRKGVPPGWLRCQFE